MTTERPGHGENDLPSELDEPAQRALAAAGIQRLEQLAKLREIEVRQLHGVGPKALSQLRRAISAKGLTFAPGERSAGDSPAADRSDHDRGRKRTKSP